MSRNYQTSIEVQALRKPTAEALDLMKPGNGTPWEDRGSTGPVPAYFQTVIKSLFAPGQLLDHIRRPETTRDANGFLYISLAWWVIGVLLYNLYWLIKVLPNSTVYEHELDSPAYYWLTAFGQGLLVALFWYLVGSFGTKMYRTMAEKDLKTVSPTLIHNCFAYSMGPSILAVVPVFGWILAAIWIYVDIVIAGKKRLYLKSSTAIVNPLLLAVGVIFAGAVAYVALRILWQGGYLELNGLKELPPPKPKPTFGAPTS